MQILHNGSTAMFKRFKALEAEAKAVKFASPKIRKIHEISTHDKVHDCTEQILSIANLPQKRTTFFRKIIQIPATELDRSIYLIATALLNTLMVDSAIDKLFYTALGRILRSDRSEVVRPLCAEYLVAQLSTSKDYTTFIEFLLRHHSEVISPRKLDILSLVASQHPQLHRRVAAVKISQIEKCYGADEVIYYTRGSRGY